MGSPNWAPRPVGLPVTALILHYTGMQTAQAAKTRLCDPEAQVSAHYLIDEDGGIEQLVDERHTAWHAGRSAWRAMNGLNVHSIGIEIVNPGHEWGYRDFPEQQLSAVIEIGRQIRDRHPIPKSNILGHSDIAPSRKQDPGERFPWSRLAGLGLGIWPEPVMCEVCAESAGAMLSGIGYRLDQTDTDFVDIIKAFQRRYRASKIDGVLDDQTMAMIRGLAEVIDRA